jgi:hypothetical protein
VVLRDYRRLRRKLYSGWTPDEFCEVLFDKNKPVWRHGLFVIKRGRKIQNRDTARSVAAPYKVRIAPSGRVSHWEIQLFYPPAIEQDYRDHLRGFGVTVDRIGKDMHFNNIGRDHRGAFVAFDW